MPPVVALQTRADTSKDTTEQLDIDEATALARLLEVSVIILRQAIDLVNHNLASDDQLTIHSQYLPGSTIGNIASLFNSKALNVYSKGNISDTHGTISCY